LVLGYREQVQKMSRSFTIKKIKPIRVCSLENINIWYRKAYISQNLSTNNEQEISQNESKGNFVDLSTLLIDNKNEDDHFQTPERQRVTSNRRPYTADKMYSSYDQGDHDQFCNLNLFLTFYQK
jgi:hypothetical protein